MTWSLNATGHSVTKEAEAEVVKLIKEFIDKVAHHSEATPSTTVSTIHHGSGSIDGVVANVQPTQEGTGGTS